MAKVTCAICGKKTDPSYNRVKHCPKCGCGFAITMQGLGENNALSVSHIHSDNNQNRL